MLGNEHSITRAPEMSGIRNPDLSVTQSAARAYLADDSRAQAPTTGTVFT